MTTNGGSSSGGGGSLGGSSSGMGGSKKAPSPVSQSSAPAGAYLGTSTSTGTSLVSNGNGTASLASSTSGGKTDRSASTVKLPAPAASESTPNSIKYLSTDTPATSGTSTGRLSAGDALAGIGKADQVGTTVTTPTGSGSAVDGPEGTSIVASPRSDFSVVLAGQLGKRPDRSPSRSNNFVSLASGAGSLGRKSEDAKRTLIGGA